MANDGITGQDREIVGELERLSTAALGGRVAHTGFLEPDSSARLVQALHEQGIPANAWGGFPGARRRVVTAFPTHVPEASTPLVALFLDAPADADSARAALRSGGAPAELLGDVRVHREGVSLVTTEPVDRRLTEAVTLESHRLTPRVVPVELAAAGSVRRVSAVVPSLRVDVIGAKGFRVSRSYFAKGVAGGKVSVNGRPAGKSSSAETGDEIYAEGLGRLRVLSVDGETKRGNTKVSLEVETAPQ
ncbi:MAG: S4 domain-containing protein [Trueperaceae bacterium]